MKIRERQRLICILFLLILLVSLIFPASADIVKKQFIVIYYDVIGFTDHSVTLNNVSYPAGSKLPIISYERSSSGEPAVIVRAKSGNPEAYPLKYFLGGYRSYGYIVTVRWDTEINHITGMDSKDEQVSYTYHRLILLLNARKGTFLVFFTVLVLLLLLIKITAHRGGSLLFAILGYAFLFLGSIQGRLYIKYIHDYDGLDWFALNATLPTKTGYDFLNIIFIPIMLAFIISIPIEFLRAFRKSVSKAPSSSVDSFCYSDDYQSETITHANYEKVNPLLKTKKIEKAIFSDNKILRNSSGGKIGRLEKAILSNDQIIKDSSGNRAGRIEQSIWDKDKQIIRGVNGKKEGEIKTDILGNKIIVDENGKKVGKIEKNIFGETVIKEE